MLQYLNLNCAFAKLAHADNTTASTKNLFITNLLFFGVEQPEQTGMSIGVGFRRTGGGAS
jgi:hypothetical protein